MICQFYFYSWKHLQHAILCHGLVAPLFCCTPIILELPFTVIKKQLDFSSVPVLCFLDAPPFFWDLIRLKCFLSIFGWYDVYSIWGQNSFGILKAFVFFLPASVVVKKLNDILLCNLSYFMFFWKLLKSSLHSECSQI